MYVYEVSYIVMYMLGVLRVQKVGDISQRCIFFCTVSMIWVWCEFGASLMRSNACEFSSISSNDVTDIRDHPWMPNRQLNLEYDKGHNILLSANPTPQNPNIQIP